MATADGPIGLLAGMGTFPEVVARAVKHAGRSLVCVQVSGETAALSDIADHYRRCAPGALTEVLGTLRAHRVSEVMLAGRFSRTDLLGQGDALRDAVIQQLGIDRRDVPLLERLAGLLADLGIVLLPQTRYVHELLARPGVLTKRAPSAEELKDLSFGREVARRIADLDIGQTIVVRRGMILAVEAAEGTDATIRRAGIMASDTVIVKASRNNQDPRFDIPAVGPETIAAMRDAAARVLGIDAHRTLVLQRDRMIAEADAADITIVAADAPPLGTPVHVDA